MNGNRLRWCQKHSNRCSSNNHVDLPTVHRIRIVWNVVAVAVRLAHRQSRFERQSKWILVKHLVWTLRVPGSNQCCGVFTWLRLLKPFYLSPTHKMPKEKQKIEDAIRSIKFRRCSVRAWHCAASRRAPTTLMPRAEYLCAILLMLLFLFFGRPLALSLFLLICAHEFGSEPAHTLRTQPKQIRGGAREHAFVHCKHHKMIKHRTLLLLIEFVSSASSAVRTTVYRATTMATLLSYALTRSLAPSAYLFSCF